LGAGWDFDDVRDFYVKSLFNVDPMQLRYADYERYLELGRLASAEVMFHAFSLWRHPESRCRGALIWFLRDLWTGPGWGIIDSHGVPKAAYHFLKRAWQPAAIFLTDEGLNGLQLHAVNDHAIAIDAIIELSLYRSNGSVVDRRSMSTTIKPHGSKSIAATDLFDGFMDLSYSYRFGPPPFDVCVARLLGSDGGTLNEDCFHPRGLGACLEEDPELAFQIAAKTQTSRTIEITARRYVYALRVDAPHWTADAQYFSVVPGQTRKVTLHTTGHSNSLNGTLVAVGNRTHAHLRITD
jgi:beta-mannosidase